MLQNTIFMVNHEPYCIWEIDLRARNEEFLQGVDVDYFDYVLNTHLATEDEKRASIALRITLHHAMETLFSLLGACVQSPDCAYAWIAKCSNKELREFVKSVGDFQNSLFTKLNINNVSWESVSKVVFSGYMPGTDRNKSTVELFASLWQRLANEYLDSNHVDEYNSLKHGFRVRSGGFALTAGTEHEYGVTPPEEEMILLGKSDYGASFFRIETLGDKKSRSIRSRKVSINWKIEKVALLLHLTSMSINNVVSALKIINGAEAGTCKFIRPQEDSEFDRPWEYSPGVKSCSIDFVIDDNQVHMATRSELLDTISRRETKE